MTNIPVFASAPFNRLTQSCVLGIGLFCAMSTLPVTAQAQWLVPGNSPEAFGAMETRFERLPLQGKLDKTPWTDTWWPHYQSGIAARWNQRHTNPLMAAIQSWEYKALYSRLSSSEISELFYYPLYSREQLLQMNSSERDRLVRTLSAAEKFDIYNGNYDYPTVARERRRTRPTAAWWEGICNGWAPAALLYSEPAAREDLVNADGIRVAFGSSDIKGLLALYQTPNAGPRTVTQIGKNCTSRNPIGCEASDLSAATFHVLLANQIGIKKLGFVLDKDPTAEVWNQPVFEYRSNVRHVENYWWPAPNGGVKRLHIRTEVLWTEDDRAHWEPLNGTSDFISDTAILEYTLELNVDGKIVDSQWGNYEYSEAFEDSGREGHRPRKFWQKGPDLVWMMNAVPFTGEFRSLQTLYRPTGR